MSERRSRSICRYEQFGQQPSVLPDVQQLYDAPIVGRDVQVPDPVLSHESQVVLQVRSHVEYPVRDGVRQHRLLLYRYSFARFFACSVQGGTYSGLQRCDILKGKSLHGIFLSEVVAGLPLEKEPQGFVRGEEPARAVAVGQRYGRERCHSAAYDVDAGAVS